MPQKISTTEKFDWNGSGWRRLILSLSPIVVAYAALLVLEGVAISWIDRWLPVSSFESATWAALFVTAGLTWCRLCLIGGGIWLVLHRNEVRRSFTDFAVIWIMASMFVAGAILAIDLTQHNLQYGGASYSGETVRSILLTLVYIKILLVYPGVRLLFGALKADEGGKGGRRFLTTWRAVSLVESLKLFCLLLLLKLTVESVVVTAISYLPFVAPFWFIPGELSRLRYFVGQGTRIVSETVGLLIYVAFFVVAVRPRLQ